MSRRLASPLRAAFVAVAFAGLAPGDAAAITNASTTTLMPWAVRLEFSKIATNRYFGCTGVALSQHWIVTSAHCLRGRANSTDRVRVDLDAATTTPLYPTGPASFYNHPDYNGTADWGDDLGLVRLYGDGILPELRAKLYWGNKVQHPGRWKDGASIFFAAGYGYGSDAGHDCPDAGSGSKRIGRFKLSGHTDDDGFLGLGKPIAVEAGKIGHDICKGDSGGPWAFAVGGNPYAETFVFGLTGGTWTRSTLEVLFLGGDPWAVLLAPKLKWITNTTARKGLPIVCHRFGEPRGYWTYRQCSEGRWEAWSNGPGTTILRQSSQSLDGVEFADVDGNGRDDALWVQSGDLYWSSGARAEGTRLTGVPGAETAFADFDGDGVDDVLFTNGIDTNLFVRYSVTGDVLAVKPYAGVTVSSLGVGDFDGDGAADVLSTGKGWRVSYGTKDRRPWTNWVRVHSSLTRLSGLRFGDFDGDGADDVLRSSTDGWYVAFSTKDRTAWSDWTKVSSLRVGISGLRIGDFDGDGADDVFHAADGAWYVSFSPRARTPLTSPRIVNRSVRAVDSLAFADVTGDGRTDVISSAGHVLRPSGPGRPPSDKVCQKKPWTPGCD